MVPGPAKLHRLLLHQSPGIILRQNLAVTCGPEDSCSRLVTQGHPLSPLLCQQLHLHVLQLAAATSGQQAFIVSPAKVHNH